MGIGYSGCQLLLHVRYSARMTTSFKPTYIFVYGTLMRGYGNHRLLDESNGNCDYIGKAITCEKYAMFASGVPFVNPLISKTIIHGEVYRVNSYDVLEAVDRLEGHPDWYVRTTINIEFTEVSQAFLDTIPNHTTIPAEIYFNSMVDDGPTSIADCICVESGNFHDVKSTY